MKKTLGLIILMLISLISIVSASTSVYVDPNFTSIPINDRFVINIKINAEDNIYAAEFKLYFDNNILTLNEVNEGNFLNKDNASTYFVPVNITKANEDGKIEFAATRLQTQEGVNGTGNLAIINFTALINGTSNLELENITFVDSELNNLPFTSIDGVIEVRETECTTDEQCDDSIYCNGQETCNLNTYKCEHGTQIDCSPLNLPEISTCSYNPDNNPFTWDYASAFTSVCDEINNECTTGTQIFIHECRDNDPDDGINGNSCGAGCETDEDCDDANPLTLDSCTGECTCKNQLINGVILISPNDEEVGPEQIFSWISEGYDKFLIQVSRNKGFSRGQFINVGGWTTANSKNLALYWQRIVNLEKLDPDKVLWWRIRAYKVTGRKTIYSEPNKFTLKPATPADLIKPEDEEIIDESDKFQWEKHDNLMCRVELSRDNLFSTGNTRYLAFTRNEEVLTNSIYRILIWLDKFDNDKVLYWRVYCRDNYLRYTHSEIRDFSIAQPEPADLILPEENAVVSNDDRFTWEKYGNRRCRLVLSRTNNFGRVDTRYSAFTINEYQLAFPIYRVLIWLDRYDADKILYWKVECRDNYNRVTYSNIRKFEI